MDEKFSYVNNRYQKRFQHLDAELKGKHYMISMHKDDVKNLCRGMFEMLWKLGRSVSC